MALPNPTGPRIAPQDDLYTTLLIAATALLLIGIVFLVVKSDMLFGTPFPPGGG